MTWSPRLFARACLLALFMLLTFVALTVFAVPVFAADLPGTSVDSLTVATALVVAWGWLAPLTVYRWIKQSDDRMKAITIGISFLIAAVALFVGGAKPELSSAAGLYAFGLLVYGEQQLVWTLLKDRSPASVK